MIYVNCFPNEDIIILLSLYGEVQIFLQNFYRKKLVNAVVRQFFKSKLVSGISVILFIEDYKTQETTESILTTVFLTTS